MGRFGAAYDKLRWGARTVGLRATTRGLARFAGLKVRRPATVRVRLAGGEVLEFDNPGQLVPSLVLFGDVIDPELLLLRRRLPRSALAIDVGAAIGQFEAVVGQTEGTTFHAYEPSGRNISRLESNLELNGLVGRVLVHQVALSDREGTALFHTTGNTFVSGVTDADESTGDGLEEIPLRVLSTELQRLGLERVDVLKVNVAGFESEVLEGALPFLADGGADLLIVLIGLRVIPILRRIQELGYRFFFYDPFADRFHELHELSEATLTAPPTPARHVLALHPRALESGPWADVTVEAL